MRHHPISRRKQHLAAPVRLSAAIAAAGLMLVAGTKSVLAEFEIQEAEVEKGEIEIEYRGAYHWGIPRAAEGVEEFGLEVNDTRQSHDIELQMGINEWLMISVVGVFEQPLGGDLQARAVEAEFQFELIERKGDGVGLAVQGEYESAINHGAQEDGEPNEFAMGPIVELAKGPLLLTLNPLFGKQIGTFADQEGLGFEYGWRGAYDVNTRWALAVEMFGEIEDLANAGSFDDQVHSIGPTILINFGGDEEDEGGGNNGPVANANGDDDSKHIGPPQMAFSMNVGVQFGLTNATSDTALKFQGALQF
jgi:hypothetical protein